MELIEQNFSIDFYDMVVQMVIEVLSININSVLLYAI